MMIKPAFFLSLGVATVGISLFSVLFSPIVKAAPAKFSLTNNTDVVITEIEVETIAGDDWGTLKEGRLVPGDTVELTINDGRTDCTYNFRVYYQDDGTKYRDYPHVNVCNNPHWSVP